MTIGGKILSYYHRKNISKIKKVSKKYSKNKACVQTA
jgi:hypothetical protein